MNVKIFVLVLLAAPALGRIRRQDTPVLPFAGQSRPGDESPSLEIQNENAEKGIVESKDAEVEEALEYVDESDPGVDPEAEMDMLEANEKPDTDAVLQDGAAVGRVVAGGSPVREAFFERYYGRKRNGSPTETPTEEKKTPWYKSKLTWIIVGVVVGIIVLLLCVLIRIKSKK